METVDDLRPLTLEDLKEMASHCYATHIYLHWTAGRYSEIYPDYHLSIDYNGRIYAPYDNLDLNQYRQHTWLRNSNAVGIALCGAYGAIANHGYDADMGDYPITDAQIEAISVVVAILCKYSGIPIENVLTHCEAALEDGYGPYSGDPETRWDLWYLRDSSDGQVKGGGDIIRGKALWYMNYY